MTPTTARLDSAASRRVRTPSLIKWGLGVVILALLSWRVITVGVAEGYPASFWASQALNGLVLGGVYALVALGYTLVYGILFMINFCPRRSRHVSWAGSPDTSPFSLHRHRLDGRVCGARHIGLCC